MTPWPSIDMRKQRIFAALDGRHAISLEMLAAASGQSKQLCSRELSRLGWKRNHQNMYRRPTA